MSEALTVYQHAPVLTVQAETDARLVELWLHLVQATLGHASVATTGKYLHARPTDSSSRYLAV